MTISSIGDLSSQFLLGIRTHDTKARLDRLAHEMAAGQVADLPRHLGARRGSADLIERDLALLTTRIGANQTLGQRLGLMQTSLDRVETARQTLSDAVTAQTVDPLRAALAGRSALEDMIGALNTAAGGRALFGGTATSGPAVMDADTILGLVEAELIGAQDRETALARLDSWFAAGGGFETQAYLGAVSSPTSPIDEGRSVTIDIRADDPGVRSALKAAVVAALAGSPAIQWTGGAATDLTTEAARLAVESAAPVAATQARLGQMQGDVEATLVAQQSQRLALSSARSDLSAADPFDSATALQEAQTLLEAQYLLTARLSQLSLTRYL